MCINKYIIIIYIYKNDKYNPPHVTKAVSFSSYSFANLSLTCKTIEGAYECENT